MRTQRCMTCGKDTPNNKFCSKSCAAVHNNKVAPKRRKSKPNSLKCKICSTPIQYGRTYCGNTCIAEDRRAEWYQSWLDGTHNAVGDNGYKLAVVRQLLIKLRGARCEICGWDKINPTSGHCPIEMDHINGDKMNNFITNLRLLCPNCHAMTPTYRYLNSSNSKTKRNVG